MSTMKVAALVIAFGGIPVAGGAQGLDWDQLPAPKHLQRVLDTDTFLRGGAGQRLRGRAVQVGAFRRSENAEAVAARIRAVRLKAVMAREGGWFIILMPETETNSAEALAGWARRSGFSDAFVRVVR